ncbi:MAG: hypothetical protein ABJB02_10890 [Dokdonella sp.]
MPISYPPSASTMASILAADNRACATPEWVAGACDASYTKALPQDRP